MHKKACSPIVWMCCDHVMIRSDDIDRLYKPTSEPFYRLKDGRYQVISPDPLTDLMLCDDRFVVSERFRCWLMDKEVTELSFEPMVVWNRADNVESHDYCLMTIGDTYVNWEDLDADPSDLQMFTCLSSGIVVTPALKRELKASEFQFKFEKGPFLLAGRTE